ncbi:MAG TPA: substrate-binding domain-containing protein [bacterium]|nr:substrate-binding domain-containing protein [bacterium]
MKRMIMVVMALSLAACAGVQTGERTAGAPAIVLGMVAKSADNPVFVAARTGAEDAARVWAERRGRTIRIDWRTPPTENAAAQAAAVEALTVAKADGILVSCSDEGALTPRIDAAAANGIPVACFDADAPGSRRFAFVGIDNRAAGAELARQLVRAMDGAGVVAVLGGNRTAPNLQERIAGVREELGRYPRMAVADVYYHVETPAAAAATFMAEQRAHPEIEGWIMAGGWALFAGAPVWLPGNDKVVAMDALPEQLDALASGRVQALVAQDCYQWGYRGVELLLALILDGELPDRAREMATTHTVTRDNLEQFRGQWQQWLRTGAAQ